MRLEPVRAFETHTGPHVHVALPAAAKAPRAQAVQVSVALLPLVLMLGPHVHPVLPVPLFAAEPAGQVAHEAAPPR